MKTLYLIGGAMGVGKTSTCQCLKRRLPNSVFLDGDWCWDMEPFRVTPETKEMVLDNICYLLNNFLRCSAFDTVIFCWVMHEQAIIDQILRRLKTEHCIVRSISLICDEESLVRRIRADVDRGIRREDGIDRSLRRLPLYERLDTEKVDVSHITAEQAAAWIAGS